MIQSSARPQMPPAIASSASAASANLNIEAFSRDPRSLFVFDTDAASGGVRPCARGRQPVLYQGAHLQRGMGQFHEGGRVHAASVDWLRGTVRLFGSKSDAMNNVPSYCSRSHNELQPCEPEHADVYVRETFAFLMRGHSILHPQCRCRPTTWQARRTAVLGLDWEAIVAEHGRGGWSSLSSRGCPAGSVGASRSLAELASELGVRSLWGAVRVDHAVQDDEENRGGSEAPAPQAPRALHPPLEGRRSLRMPLLQVLVELASLTPVRSACGEIVGLTSPVCCVPSSIESGSDIEAAARVLAPRPFVYRPDSHDVVTRRSVCCELQALVRARRVRVVQSDVEGAWAVAWNGHAMHLEPQGLFGSSLRCEGATTTTTTTTSTTVTTGHTRPAFPFTKEEAEEEADVKERDVLLWMRQLWEAHGPQNALLRWGGATTASSAKSKRRRI
jgi:hypothetical protein